MRNIIKNMVKNPPIDPKDRRPFTLGYARGYYTACADFAFNLWLDGLLPGQSTPKKNQYRILYRAIDKYKENILKEKRA